MIKDNSEKEFLHRLHKHVKLIRDSHDMLETSMRISLIEGMLEGRMWVLLNKENRKSLKDIEKEFGETHEN